MENRYVGPQRPAQGVTLAELLLAIALLGILLTWSAPSFISLYQRNALITEANRLLTHLMHARSEAITRNVPIVICRSDGGNSCLSSSKSRADWGMGWITFADTNEDKTKDRSEPVIRVGEKLSPTLSLRFNQWWRLTFQPTGRTGNGTFTLCSHGGEGRLITIYRSGRFRLSKTESRSKGSDQDCPPP